MNSPQKPRLDIKQQLNDGLRRLARYKVVIAVLFVAAVYGFIAYKISVYDNAQPSADQINAQASPVASAHIDKSVVSQLQKLQDNSVSVQALFQQARNNPFQD